MMYYIYLLELVIVGLLLLIIPNYLIYKIVLEQDKIVYIKGYKAKWKPLTILSEVIYCIVTFGLITIFIPALIYYLASKKVDQKKLRNTFAILLATPIIGIVLPILWLIGIQSVAINHDMYALNNLLGYLRIIHLFASIPFYSILSLKQYLKLLAIENTIMYKFVKESEKFNERESKRKLWPTVKFEEEFSNIYLVGYQNEEEWNNDRFTIMNYGLLYKLITMFSSVTVLATNIIIAILYFEVLNHPYPISPTNYEIMASPILGDQFVYFYTYFTIFSFLTIALFNLTFIFNGKIVLKGKQYNDIASYHSYNEISGSKELRQLESSQWNVIKITQKVFIGLFITGWVASLFVYPVDSANIYRKLGKMSGEYAYLSLTLEKVSFDEYKADSVSAVKDKNNYKDYSKEEKYGYVMHHPDDIFDDLESLGFINEDTSETNSYQYEKQFNLFHINIQFTEEYNTVYPNNYDFAYIYISRSGFNIVNETSGQYFGGRNIVFDTRNDENSEEYTPEELALYNDMVDTVYELTDTLFAMEMEDQGIDL